MPTCGFLESPSLTAAVTKIFPPLTIGEDQPRPGISAVHSTFSVFDQVAGNRVWDTGLDSGPRKRGHSGTSAGRA